jgi:hypothetical protein
MEREGSVRWAKGNPADEINFWREIFSDVATFLGGRVGT